MHVIRNESSLGAKALKKPGFGLPEAFLDKAVGRLGVVALISAISWPASLATFALLQPETLQALQRPLIRLTHLGIILISVALVALQRSGWFSKQTILHFGSFYQVLIAFGIALCEGALLKGPDYVIVGVSSVTLWILLCGILIPNTPLSNMFAGVFTALAWPAAYFVIRSVLGYEFIGWNLLMVWLMPLVLCAFWTNFLNRHIYAMRVQTQRAEELGSYTLDTLIGQGGMGEVWRARHKMLARDAAVKLIRPEVLAGQNMRNASVIRKRFEREAEATASLRSPHTVALYDFGVAQDGAFYYVMELLEGIDLQALVERYGPLPAGRVKNIMIQVCESLDEAHSLGMVHRDIKPRNIMIGKVGRQYDFAKVLDFGLVKGFAKGNETLLSVEGAATGTPAYIAPEVAMATPNIDGRADLYSLACVAYYLLTGELVFNEHGTTAVVVAHVQKTPLPPSQRTELLIPAGLERIVLQCLEKDPDKRPRSARELARLLEALRDVPPFDRLAAAKWWDINLPGQNIPVLTPESDSVRETARA